MERPYLTPKKLDTKLEAIAELLQKLKQQTVNTMNPKYICGLKG